MFKKVLFMCCMCVLSISSVFAAIPEGWGWNLTDVVKLKEIQNKTTDEFFLSVIQIQTALSEKDSTNISYDDFKKIVNDTNKLKNYKEVVPQFVFCVKRFNAFDQNVLNDGDFKSLPYLKHNGLRFYQKDPEAFRKFFFVDKKVVLFQNDKNPVHLNRLVDIYTKNMVNYSNEEILSDLQLLKKITYPKIAINEQWKQLAVKIELLLKSVQ